MNEANNEKLETDPGADLENVHKPKVIRVMSAEIEDAVQKMGKKDQSTAKSPAKASREVPSLQLPGVPSTVN